MAPKRLSRRYRSRYCGYDFPAALPVTGEPDGAMLLNHLAAMHRDQVGPLPAAPGGRRGHRHDRRRGPGFALI
jgi:hypothetical protein